MTPTDKAAIEGLIQNWRKSATHYQIDNWQSTSPKSPDVVNAAEVAVKLCADELEQALQRLLAGETREGVQRSIPISEIRALWMPLTSLPNIEAAGKFMSGMSKLIERYDHD